jgi:hypothetical protein
LKNRLLILVCFVGLIATATQAGLFKNSVDLADLSEVSPDSLETLRETEFAVFVAQVRLNTAKAEQKAAKANQDEERTTAATARVTGAREDLQTAKALRKWKAQEGEARQAEVAMEKSALDLAEAKRDAAADFERSVANRQKEYDAASRKAQDKMAKVDQLEVDWSRLARNVGFATTE